MNRICGKGHMGERYANGQCKICSAERVKEWREKNKNKIITLKEEVANIEDGIIQLNNKMAQLNNEIIQLRGIIENHIKEKVSITNEQKFLNKIKKKTERDILEAEVLEAMAAPPKSRDPETPHRVMELSDGGTFQW